MAFNRLDAYMDECRALQRGVEDLQIVCGFECDHHPRYVSWYRERLLDSGFADYLAFGVHYLSDSKLTDTFVKKLPATSSWLHIYTDLYIDALKSGLYRFGVHPDLFGVFYTRWDQEAISCSHAILSCAADLQIPLEINGYGCRKPMIDTAEGMRWQYPVRQFWELASQYDLQVIVNSDAHTPEDLDVSGVGAYELAHQCNLELVDWQVELVLRGDSSIQQISPVRRS
jgi:histidinol-phosphatase (PHP family)